MHVAQAVLPQEEALKLASREVARLVERNQAYYARLPDWTPDAARPLVERIRVADAWYYVPFARRGEKTEPLVVRVNGLTKVVVVDRSF